MKKYRLSLSSRAILLAAGASLAMPVMAETETAEAAAVDQPAEQAAASSSSDDIYDDTDGDEIIVTAPRLAGQLERARPWAQKRPSTWAGGSGQDSAEARRP